MHSFEKFRLKWSSDALYQCLILQIVGKAIDEGGLSHACLSKNEDGEAIEGLEVPHQVRDFLLGKELKLVSVLGTVAAKLKIDHKRGTTAAIQALVEAILQLGKKKSWSNNSKSFVQNRYTTPDRSNSCIARPPCPLCSLPHPP